MCNGKHQDTDATFWLYDKLGIPFARVCEGCREKKLAEFQKLLTSTAKPK